MSPRPKKERYCEGDFCGRAFKPTGSPLQELQQLNLHRDELEALRLCDFEGLTQEEAGKRMGVFQGNHPTHHHRSKEKKRPRRSPKARHWCLWTTSAEAQGVGSYFGCVAVDLPVAGTPQIFSLVL